MKATGVTRKIDELGRIVIPKEIRKNLGIRDGEALEIYTSDDSIILKKYSELQSMRELSLKLSDIISNIFKVDVIVCDREKVMAASMDNELVGAILDKKLMELIDNRESVSGNKISSIKLGDKTIDGYITIVPIIASIDSLGLVIVVSKTGEYLDNLAKLMAEIISKNVSI